MAQKVIEDEQLVAQESLPQQPRFIPRIEPRHLFIVAFVVICAVMALVLPFLEYKFQMALILVPPAILVGVLILRNPYFGICLFFLYEFSRPDSFVPALRPLKVAMLIEILTLTSWVFHIIRNRKQPLWPNFNWIFIAYLAVIGSTTLTAMNNRFAYNIFQSTAVYFLIYLIAINVVDSLKRLTRLIWILFLVHFYFGIKGIGTGGFVGGSLMGDENDYALAMNMMIPFAFFMFFDFKNKIKKFGVLIVMIALTLGTIASLSRGGWVGLIVTVIFCIIKSKRILISLAVTAVLAVAIMAFAPAKYWDEIQTITDTKEATAASRINYWKAAMRMYSDYPITGVGANNGGVRMAEYVTGFRDSATQWGRAFHGTIPQLMAELGSLGLICYLLMYLTALKYLYRIQKRPVVEPDDNSVVFANAIMGSMISYLTTATFLSTTYYPQLITLYTLTIILVNVTKTKDAEIAARQSSQAITVAPA